MSQNQGMASILQKKQRVNGGSLNLSSFDKKLTAENLETYSASGSRNGSRNGSRAGSRTGSRSGFDDNFDELSDLAIPVESQKPRERERSKSPQSSSQQIDKMKNVKLPDSLDFGIDKLANRDIIKTISEDELVGGKMLSKALQSSEVISLPLNKNKHNPLKINQNATHNQPQHPSRLDNNNSENPFVKDQSEDEDYDEGVNLVDGDSEDADSEDDGDGEGEGEGDEDGDGDDDAEGDSDADGDDRPKMTRIELLTAKRTELTKLEKLVSRGFSACKIFSMADKYQDIKNERIRLQDEKELQDGIKSQRAALIKFSGLLEFGNKYYDPFGLKLEGFSENVLENITDYDDVFEELYEKYKESVSVSPEIKLIGIFVGSAISFHFSKMVIEKASQQIPDFNEVMSSNPQLRRQYEDAAKARVSQNGQNNGIGSKIGGFMGNNSIGNFIGGLFGNNQQDKNMGPAQTQTQSSPVRMPTSQNSKSSIPIRKVEIDMDGPKGVDDLINGFTKGTNHSLSEKRLKDLDDDNNLSEFVTSKRKTKNN